MSSAIQLATTAGFIVHDTPGEPIRWGVSQQVFSRAARFQDFIKEAMLASDDTSGLCSARMIALDAIPLHALNQITAPNTYACLSGVAVQWETNDPLRTERRLLNPLTVRCLTKTDAPSSTAAPPVPGNPSRLDQLEVYLNRSDSYRTFKHPMQVLELDALCHWHDILPSSLFAHVSKLQPLSTLSRAALARLEQKLALAEENQPTHGLDESIFAELVDATLDSMGDDTSPIGVDLLLSILKDKPSPIDGVTKRAWLGQLAELRHRFASHGPVTCLLATWLAHMLEEGTMGTRNPTAETLARYTAQAAQPLRKALNVLHVELGNEPWRTEILRGVYTAILESHGGKNKGTLRSALSNFHHFLSEVFEVEPLRVPLPGEHEAGRINANIVWPHELELALAWTHRHPDARIGATTRLLLEIGSEAPVRIDELQRLRMRHVSFFSEGETEFAEIEIARHAASGRLKTTSSQRRLSVTNPLKVSLLKAWHQQRQDEGAPQNAYLFGEPFSDSNRYQAGRTHAFVNRLLKAASGDSQVSFHNMRHGVISRAVESIWLPTATPIDSSQVDVNPLEVLAAQAGHASPISTLCTYTHLYEVPLRQWLDHGIWNNLDLTSTEAEHVTGMRSAAIRQQVHRRKTTLPHFVSDFLETQNRGWLKKFPHSAEVFKWVTPQPPVITGIKSSMLTPAQALEMMLLIADGMAIQTVSMRYSIDSATLQTAVSRFIPACHAQARNAFPRHNQNSHTPKTIAAAFSLLALNPKRANQKKYKPLIEQLACESDIRILQDFAFSIEHLRQGEYLTLTHKHQAILLMASLHHLKVPGIQLRICIRDHRSRNGTFSCGQRLIAAADAEHAFETAFLHKPRATSSADRTERPSAYLLWDSTSGDPPSSAGSSIEGMFVIALSVQFFLLLKGV